MKIKMIPFFDGEPQSSDEARDRAIYSGELVVEATQYRLRELRYDSCRERDQWVAQITDKYFVPFGLQTDQIYTTGSTEGPSDEDDYTVEPRKGHAVLLEIIEPYTETNMLLLENCHLFVMNEQGTTIDTFTA